MIISSYKTQLLQVLFIGEVIATYEHQHVGDSVVCCKGTPYANGSGNTFTICFYYIPRRNVVEILKRK